jgi:uncharacterized lipoprotein YmbA
MNERRCLNYLPMALIMAVAMSGCFGTTPQSRFYSLTPRESSEVSFPNGPNVFLEVGPVTIPSYLNRNQIVTRTGRNEIAIAEFDRWGGYLDEEITRLLVINLTERLAPKGIAVIPWRSVSLPEAPTAYRISVSLNRFEGTPGETVVLSAVWGLLVKKEHGEESLLTQETTLSEEVKGRGYDALVTAMGNTLDRLGKEMGDRISSALPAKTKVH